MNLDEYKEWFVLDEGHWYVSKVKQYKPSAIQEFARGLRVIDEVINAEKDSEMYRKFHEFQPAEQYSLFKTKNILKIDESVKLFICLFFMQRDLVNLSHLETTNR